MEAEVEEVRRSFWRGRTAAVLVASRDRVLGPSESCAGCDWSHFEPAAARGSKRALFLETMQRIGKLPAETFGDLPIVPSALGYRIRNRFHLGGRGRELVIGQFAGRTHRIEPVAGCRALTPQTAALLPSLRDGLAATGASVSELATLEDPSGDRRLVRATLGEISKRQARTDGEAVGGALAPFFAGVRVVDREGRVVLERGETRLSLEVGGRSFLVSADSFFQGNRHLAGRLLADVGEASQGSPGDALDAFGGVGFFAAALLDAGHSVTSVEGSPSAARDAAKTRLRWADADRWRIVPSSVGGFLSSSSKRFDLTVVDPPRAGLARLGPSLGERVRRRFIYVSCEPSTLARDLSELLSQGFEVVDARLYDLFPLTHRVESVVTLVRRAGAA